MHSTVRRNINYRGFYVTKKNYLVFQYFDYEHIWWRLFQQCVMHTKFNIYIFITKITIHNGQYSVNRENFCFNSNYEYIGFSYVSLYTILFEDLCRTISWYSNFYKCPFFSLRQILISVIRRKHQKINLNYILKNSLVW